MPYSWVNETNQAEIAALHEKYSKRAMTSVAGIPVFATSEVEKEWETKLSDILFMVTGFSQFFGALAFQCHYKWSLAVPTAGALVQDGQFYVIMNPLFVFNFLNKPSYRAFVVVHEVHHIFYEHGDRAIEAGYDHQLFNKACDYYIHLSMDRMIEAVRTRSAGVELIPKDVFPICFDRRFDGMTEDEIYRALKEEEEKEEEDDKSDGDDGESSGEGSEGSGDGSGSGSAPGSGTGDSEGEGSGDQPLDDPIKVAQGESEASTKNKQAVASAVRSAAVQASQSPGIGDVELGIIRKFLEATEAKVDWRAQFMDFFESTRTNNPTYSIYNRRSSDDVVFPSKTGDHINVFFGTDSSGSMSEEDLVDVRSELKGIIEQCDSWNVTVASCDTEAYEIARLASSEEEDLDDAVVELKGGGGTRLSPLVEMMQDDEEAEYNVAVIITDGGLVEGDITNAYNGEVPLIVVVTRNGIVPPWIEAEVTTIKME